MTGKPVGPATHLKIKCFWLHVSVTDQQKGTFYLSSKGNKPSYDPKNAFSGVYCSIFAKFQWLRLSFQLIFTHKTVRNGTSYVNKRYCLTIV